MDCHGKKCSRVHFLPKQWIAGARNVAECISCHSNGLPGQEMHSTLWFTAARLTSNVHHTYCSFIRHGHCHHHLKSTSTLFTHHISHCQNIHSQSQNCCLKNFLIFGKIVVPQSARICAIGGVKLQFGQCPNIHVFLGGGAPLKLDF